MTEYGVQTNNIFDLLNAADEGRSTQAAKPKPRKKQGGAQSAPKKDQGGAKPSGQRPASTQVRATTVTVSGGRGSGRSPQAAPAAGNAPAAGGRGNTQGARPQSQQRPALARGTEEFVRRHDDSHVSFAEEKGKPAHGRHEGAPATKHNAPNHGRQFDRHSGTGRSPVENKKGGAGQGNWGGNPQDELAAVEDVKAELAEAEAAKNENKNKKKKKKGKKPEEEEEKEKTDEIPDEQLKTLDDFLKERNAKAAKLSLPPPRTAGEGVKVDPKWAEAVKREAQDEVFVKVKEEPKKEVASPTTEAKPSKSSLRKRRKKEAKEAAAKKLAEENITNMFDFSAKKEDFPRGGRREGGRGPRRDGPPREGQRGPREGGQRGPREGGQRGPRGNGSGRNNNVQPRRYKVDSDNAGPQFDDSAFPALQVGPPPITAD